MAASMQNTNERDNLSNNIFIAIKLKSLKNQRSVVKKPTNSTASTTSGHTNGQISTTSGTMNTACAQTNRRRSTMTGQMCTTSEQTNTAIGANVLRVTRQVIR